MRNRIALLCPLFTLLIIPCRTGNILAPVKFDPSDASTCLEQGNWYFNQGHWKWAGAYYDLAIEMDSSNAITCQW